MSFRVAPNLLVVPCFVHKSGGVVKVARRSAVSPGAIMLLNIRRHWVCGNGLHKVASRGFPAKLLLSLLYNMITL